jgi:hypothetical protein
VEVVEDEDAESASVVKTAGNTKTRASGTALRRGDASGRQAA